MSAVNMTVNRVANYVGGEPVASPTKRALPVSNPTTGEIIAEAPDGGYFIGPSIVDGVDPSHGGSCEEIFGPVLTIHRCATFDEALAIENNNPYGNAAAVYTSSGKVAQIFVERAGAGMIGVNIGVPVPREPFAFGGWFDSRFGEGDITGFGAIDFWSQSKKVTTKWSDEHRINWMS